MSDWFTVIIVILALAFQRWAYERILKREREKYASLLRYAKRLADDNGRLMAAEINRMHPRPK